ncbi:MAG: hypothetical protein ACREFC_02810 [Stellaceae bacterium]
MPTEWDEEGARRDFQAEKFVSLSIDWVVEATFWDRDGGAVGLDWVPITDDLRKRFVAWWNWAGYRHEIGGETRREKDNAPFPDIAEFEAEGRAIAVEMKRQLPDWQVEYYADYSTRRKAIL